jgi:hypothetical protein
VDELADFSKTSSHSPGWKIADRDCRAAKEDAHRAAGVAGNELVYELPTTIQSFQVFTFFPKAVSGVKFYISADGKNFHELSAQKETYFHGSGEYGYWQPILFHTEKVDGGNFLKIQLAGETQIGRVEISHEALSK